MAIVNVTYGHQKLGKLYAYRDPTGTRRAGDEVMVKVTKGNNTYKTLGVVRSTHGTGTAGASDTMAHLDKEGIGLKTLEGRQSQKQLPGYYEGWAKDAKAQYDLEKEYRLMPGMTDQSFKRVQKQIRDLRFNPNPKGRKS